MWKLLALCLTAACVAAEDYYKVLGIHEDANEKDIKQAFRKLSKQYHPDRNRGNEDAQKKFLEISKAHDALSDPAKRQVYDMYGEEGLNDPNQLHKERGPTYRFELEATLEDVYNGTTKDTTIRRNELCKKCKGTGAKNKKTVKCSACGGKGIRLQDVGHFGFVMQMQVHCERCGGKGFIPAERCPQCRGQRVSAGQKTFPVQIEQGMDTSSEITFTGESEQNPDWFPGDIIFVLKLQEHRNFRRTNHDLHTQVRLSLEEALLGYSKEISHLDGHLVRIEYTGVTQPQSVRLIRGEGMPHHDMPSMKGDLHVQFIVSLPARLSTEQKDIVAKMLPDCIVI